MKPAIVLQTDFTKDISTCTMEGVCQMVDPTLRTFDATHAIPSFNTWVASTSLAFIVNYWPQGTVFVSVVDPGVGTDRRGCVALLANGSYVVTPDNGTLTHMLLDPGILAIRQIDESVNRLPGSEGVNIFHGRDVFAYTAARLAAGVISFDEVGPQYPVEEVIRHEVTSASISDGVISGMIELNDTHFGLVSSNIPMELFEKSNIEYGTRLQVTVSDGEREVYRGTAPYVPSFGSVEVGEALLLNSEAKTIELAINERNISEIYGIGAGPGWTMQLSAVAGEE